MSRVVTQQHLNRSPKTSLLFGLFLLLVPIAPIHAMEEVEQARNLLKKMAAANRELDYRGSFTYEYAGTLKAVRITHVVADDLEYESLLYLNGPRREVVRGGLSPECRKGGDDFLAGVPVPTEFASHLETNYELYLRGEDRVADRDVRVIHVVPKDGMRYGYILSLDKETGLLLQSLLVGTSRRVMERFQYVDISYQLDSTEKDALVAKGQEAPAVGGCVEPSVADLKWQAKWLPDGFRLVSASSQVEGQTSMVFSDGLSFVSVFVSADGNPAFPPIQAQRGATVAQIARLNHNGKEYAICVVGEVPPTTAERIAQFVGPK